MYIKEIVLYFKRCFAHEIKKATLPIRYFLGSNTLSNDIPVKNSDTDELSTPLLSQNNYEPPIIDESMCSVMVESGNHRNNRNTDLTGDRNTDLTDDTNCFLIQDMKKEDAHYVKNKQRVSGIIKIIFFFYQIEAIIRTNTPAKSDYKYSSWIVRNLLASIFNIKLDIDNETFKFCVVKGLTMI